MKYPQVVSMPSAVSDWLEEQLEARGIDSEVYTRYILSLLHAHTLDLIYPEEDFAFHPIKKEEGRGHKRVRRSGSWWRHANEDPEQIKRSAAVECLMSAADQNCEVESLVDELCEKLKKVDSETEITSAKPAEPEKPQKSQKASTKELAEKYYAAFPPLNQKEGDSYITSNIHLVVGKWPSPEKSADKIDLIAGKWTSGSPKKSTRRPKRQTSDINMKLSRGQNKNKIGYKKAHCVRGLTKEMEDNMANWEYVYNNNNNNYNVKDRYSTVVREEPIRFGEDSHPTRKSVPDFECFFGDDVENIYNQLISEENQFTTSPKENGSVRNFLEIGSPVSKVWSPSRHMCTICQKPKDKHEQDLPMPNSFNFMRKANLQLTGLGSIRGDRPFGHIIGGMEYDAVREYQGNAFPHGNQWFEFISTNGTKVRNSFSYLEKLRFVSSENWNKAQDTASKTTNAEKLNVEKEPSAFAKYIRPVDPPPKPESPYVPTGPQPYSRAFGRPVKGPPLPSHVVPCNQDNGNGVDAAPTEDMWGQAHLYFRPIKSPPLDKQRRRSSSSNQRVYPDGATFAIDGNWDQVNYQRNSDGELYLLSETGEKKIYQHYNIHSPTRNLESCLELDSPNKHFSIKFEVKQLDKACQCSEEDFVGLLTTVHTFPEPNSFQSFFKEWDFSHRHVSHLLGTQTLENNDELVAAADGYPADISFDDFIVKTILETLLDDSDPWPDEVEKDATDSADSSGNQDHLKMLWSQVEFQGETVSNDISRPDIARLREEASVEGNLLLEEVGCAQQFLRSSLHDDSTDVDDQVSPGNDRENADQKHKYSSMGKDGIWSFTSKIEDDCLVNMFTFPASLQPVTL
ncbi:uncharacterized protein LOC115882703 isoform X1 [Sitophilus oryzae]|uniref:Uncharacterized protein LOC115882703 isoform X1 n=1 Tax=Sitophilus oryzae TaxID=7048 RepID=A0A6J2Y191_SITOR|nr:uncharacterized protein LOC115882703 isoform X1 [Sitophilus oryzae]XP_030756781.1 uncharacterized protein LOC115882703 isoform X1 [Sitophilus oryzae]XP_030756782.1 uncharacterized protein LOC115882703 isoform X1 [Sitophilus oryzae]